MTTARTPTPCSATRSAVGTSSPRAASNASPATGSSGNGRCSARRKVHPPDARGSPVAADLARRIPVQPNRPPVHRQRVEEQEPPAEGFTRTGEELERLGRLGGPDDPGERCEDAEHCAALLLRGSVLGEETAVAGAV